MKRPGTLTYPKTVSPWELEPHYSHHVGAMTSEGLHDKADIAFQLALRDQRLAALSRIVRRTLACGQLEKLEDAKRWLDDSGQSYSTETETETEAEAETNALDNPGTAFVVQPGCECSWCRAMRAKGETTGLGG